MKLADRVAIITGSAEGIGRGCALVFADQGARVVVADRNEQAGMATAQAIEASGGRAIFTAVDVSSPEQAQAMVRQAVTAFGRLDILVNNAGIGGRKLGDGPIHACTIEAWDAVMNVNLRGTFLACKFAIPELLRTGGNIVTISSVLGMVGTQGLFDTHAYAASKAGLIGLTRAIAAHYARQHLRANVIAPGLVDTQMASRTKSNPALLQQVEFWQPLGPLIEVTDVAQAAVFLASDDAKFITGVVLPVDGGWTAQ